MAILKSIVLGGLKLIKSKSEIPIEEKWLYENARILASVKRGLKQARKGKLIPLEEIEKTLRENDEQS